MSPEQRLWQGALLRNVMDATNPAPKAPDDVWASRSAKQWIESNCRDFRHVCSMAGVDASMIRSAFLEGRIDHASLVSADMAHAREARMRAKQ